MSNDSEKLIDHCIECGEHPEELTNNICNNCIGELELSDSLITPINARTIDLTKAN